MTSTVPQLSHADVTNIMRLVEALNRSKLHFIRIEANSADIQIAKDGTPAAEARGRAGRAALTLTEVTAPSVGVFRADGAVRLGAQVSAGTRLGHVQTLDETTAVEAAAAGKIIELVAQDGVFVEYGEALIKILAAPTR